MCVKCYGKKNTLTLEGQLRGDKGVKQEESVTSEAYFKRALLLVRDEWRIFGAAMFCLLVYSVLSLFVPRIQGNILDAVVGDNHHRFNYWIKAYLVISILSGIFSGLQSLFFNIVGRKLSNTIREKLYRGIVMQDVAFFDGNSSGQLTSRLTTDVGFMVRTYVCSCLRQN